MSPGAAARCRIGTRNSHTVCAPQTPACGVTGSGGKGAVQDVGQASSTHPLCSSTCTRGRGVGACEYVSRGVCHRLQSMGVCEGACAGDSRCTEFRCTEFMVYIHPSSLLPSAQSHKGPDVFTPTHRRKHARTRTNGTTFVQEKNAWIQSLIINES